MPAPPGSGPTSASPAKVCMLNSLFISFWPEISGSSIVRFERKEPTKAFRSYFSVGDWICSKFNSSVHRFWALQGLMLRGTAWSSPWRRPTATASSKRMPQPRWVLY
jgi:hypothetical protein